MNVLTRSIVAGSIVMGAMSLFACSAESPTVEEPEQEVTGQTEEALAAGGCSMGRIRELQSYCRTMCGMFGDGSRGIHYCTPDMDAPWTEVCACSF